MVLCYSSQNRQRQQASEFRVSRYHEMTEIKAAKCTHIKLSANTSKEEWKTTGCFMLNITWKAKIYKSD